MHPPGKKSLTPELVVFIQIFLNKSITILHGAALGLALSNIHNPSRIFPADSIITALSDEKL